MSHIKKQQLIEIEACIRKLEQVKGLGVVEVDHEKLFELIISINQHLPPLRCHRQFSEDYYCGSE